MRRHDFFYCLPVAGGKVMDPLERLREIAGKTGEVNPVYGGFEVGVLKPSLFPWYTVLNYLLEIGQEVCVRKSEGEIQISTEPQIQ
ncbi:MAG: hypothetical protein A2157_03520 [Deltaproteobacteria bacterium RBG_16_47_11]|nr:MAG: hypothetical protein A2157_03520 [Deltaproteobacteria bacterium RBG_16_47_11]